MDRFFLPMPATMRSIAEHVALRSGVSMDDLKGPSARRAITRPRQEAYWITRQVKRPDGTPRYSLTMIGQFYGGRDHTTIRYGVLKHEALLASREAAE